MFCLLLTCVFVLFGLSLFVVRWFLFVGVRSSLWFVCCLLCAMCCSSCTVVCVLLLFIICSVLCVVCCMLCVVCCCVLLV